MSKRSLVHLWALISMFVAREVGLQAEDPSATLELIPADVAFCLEIPALERTLTELESGPLAKRLQAFPPFQRLLESPGFQQWQAINQHVAGATGTPLVKVLRDLFANSLVVAIDVPAEGAPRGLLIGEAKDPDAIKLAINVWNKLEPNAVLDKKEHQHVEYFQRMRPGRAVDPLFFAVSDRWFAISDQEHLIQNVIDRVLAAKAPVSTAKLPASLKSHPQLIKARQRLKQHAAAYVHINARPWDRGIEESSAESDDPIQLLDIWKRVKGISACLQFDRGIICETVIDLDPALLSSGWSQFVEVATGESTWFPQIPADSLMAVCGRIDLKPLIAFIVSQVTPQEQAEFAQLRRIVQSLFHGRDVLDSLLPVLGKDFCGYVTTRIDERTRNATLDGAVGFSLGELAQDGTIEDIDHGLDASLRILAAFLSGEGRDVVTVQRDVDGTHRQSSLSVNTPFPIAYGISGNRLVIAGTEARLKASLTMSNHSSSTDRLPEHAQQFFPGTSQLVWFDTALTRQVLERQGEGLAKSLTFGSAEDAARLMTRFDHLRHVLSLVDSVFIAGRLESECIWIVWGGGLDRGQDN